MCMCITQIYKCNKVKQGCEICQDAAIIYNFNSICILDNMNKMQVGVKACSWQWMVSYDYDEDLHVWSFGHIYSD